MAIESFSNGMEMVLKGETWGGMRVGDGDGDVL